MSIYINHTFFSCVDRPQRRIYSEGSTLYLTVKEQQNKACIDFKFKFGDASKENARELQHLLDLLTKNNRGGLFALLKYSNEPDQILCKKSPVSDRFISGFSGYFNSQLEVADGCVIYHIDLNSPYCKGFAHFDLGVAMKNRIRVLNTMIEGFEMDYLSVFIEKVINRNLKDEQTTKQLIEYIYQE